MDWSKAKTILILALLIVCMVLSGILISRRVSENRANIRAIEDTKEYLKTIHAELNAEIPNNRPSLPVLFVEYDKSSEEELTYKTYKVFTASGDSKGLVLQSEGKEKAKVISASSALLKVVTEPTDYSGIINIKAIDLVYYIDVDTTKGESVGNDTAIPYWRIETNLGLRYINAYAQ